MRVRTTRFLSIAVVVAGTSLVLTANANAIPGPDTIPEVIAAVGSDTTFAVDGAIFAAANKAAVNTDPDKYVNVSPTLAPGAPCFDVPGDKYYPAHSYCNPATATSPLPPDGSTAGKTALKNSAAIVGNGQVDIARSSSPRNTATDPATFEYYGYAKDGVSWAASSTGKGAKVTLTLAALRGIYDGSITDWSDPKVGGAPSPIKVYLPQAGSGTLAFFTSKVLGFDPTTKPVTISRFQENDATTIAAADQASAIAPYSIAQWVAQGNSVVADKRAGFFEGTLTGAGSDGPPVTGAPGTYAPAFLDAFLGARTVYHVVDTRTPSYGAALNVVGYDGTGPSPLCAGDLASTLTQYGFKPLPLTAGLACTKE
jgi:phosphate transport system substrate-binding protein